MLLSRIHPSDRFTAPAAGYRHRETGVLSAVGLSGFCLTSTPAWRDSDEFSRIGCLAFNQNDVRPLSDAVLRSEGISVRCVQHLQAALSFQGELYE